MNTIKYFTDRIFKICDEEYIEENMDNLIRLGLENGFPPFFIKKISKKSKELIIAPSTSTNDNSIDHEVNNNIPKFYASFPYINGVSEVIKKILLKYNIDMVIKPGKGLKNLFNNKDPIPKMKQKGVVYSVQCLDCQKRYVGQTKRPLGVRMDEHKRSVARGATSTALSQHALEKCHSFDFPGVKILTHENNKHKREFLEKCYIYLEKDRTINHQTDLEGLNLYFVTFFD